MSSATIRLAARGEQDLWLTGTPKQTYFLALYRKREPYVLETYEVPFDTTIVPYGTTATCTLPAKGDLMHKVTLKCTLPALFYRKAGWCYPVTSTSFQPFIYLFDSSGNVIELLQVRSNQAFYTAAVRTWVPVSTNLTSVGYDGTRLTYTTSATVARIGFLATDASFFGFDPNLGTKFGLSGIVTYTASTTGLAAPFTLEQSGWVPGFVPPTGLNYVDSVGTYLIKTAELLVGGQTIDVVTGEYIDIRQDLEVQYENQAALLLLNGKGDTSTIQLARTYYITLPFTPEMDLPIRDLYRQDVRVNVSFEQFSRLTSTDVPLSGYGFSNAASCTVITVPNPTLFSNTACYDGSNVYVFSYNTFGVFNPKTTFALSSFINVGDAGANSIVEASFVINGRVYAVTTDQYIVSFPVINNDTYSSFLTTSYTVAGWIGLTRRAACSDGRYIYVYAGVNDAAQAKNTVYKFDTQSLTVESFVATGVSGVVGNLNLQCTPSFDGRYVYFTDKYQSAQILRYDTTASFTTAGSWTLFNYTTTLSVAQQNYLASIFDGRYMYWITDAQQSTNAVTWLRYDTTLAFASAGSWQTFVITGVTGVTTAAQFRSPVFDGQYIYMSSSSSLPIFLRYDTTKAFNAAGSYDWFNYTTGVTSAGPVSAIQIGGTNTFNVNIFDGRYIYSLPLGTSNVLRQDTSTVIAPTNLQTSLIVDYVSGPNKTEIKPQEFIVSQTSLTQSPDPTFRLDIQAPVKEAFIVSQTPASASGPYAYNALTNVELRFNDEKVFDWTSRTIEPYVFHSTMPQRTMALVSFSQDPEANNKVAGSVNLARIRDIQMTVPSVSNTVTRVYTRSYNVLRVENGIGGLKFMSPPFKTMYQPNNRWIYTSNVLTTASIALPLFGNALSATQIGGIVAGTGPGTGSATTPTSVPVQKIVADVNGNIHVTGTYRGNTIQFGQGATLGWGGGTPDSFFAMYNSAGTLLTVGYISGFPLSVVASTVISGVAVHGTNAYLAGYYSGAATALVVNGVGFALPTPASGATNMFVAKLTITTTGYYPLWVTYGASATASSVCAGLAISADSEGCYITGNFTSATAATFYNADTTNTTNATLAASVGTRDGFLVKFNTIGTPLWTARMAVASSTVNATGIACSPDAGVVVVGSWTGATALSIYWSSVSAAASLTSSTTLAGQANQTYTSVAATGGTGSGARFTVSRNASGVVVLAGITVAVSGSGYTNGDSLTIAGATVGGATPTDNIVFTVSTAPTAIGGSTNNKDAFVAKYTTAGGVTWVSRIGAGGQGPMSVAVGLDRSINVTGGILNGTWALYTQPGTTSAASTGAITNSCAYVAKWDSAGTGQWIQLITTDSASPNYGLGIAVDAFANVFATGLMYGTTTFGGTKTFSSMLGQDGYVAKYTPTGALAWVSQMDQPTVETKTFGGSVWYDRRAGVLWTIGCFSAVTYFYNNNSATSGATLTVRGNYDTFIVKYSA
jgi:hypothetical protein